MLSTITPVFRTTIMLFRTASRACKDIQTKEISIWRALKVLYKETEWPKKWPPKIPPTWDLEFFLDDHTFCGSLFCEK